MVRRMSRVVGWMTCFWILFLAWVGWGIHALKSVEQPAYSVIERRGNYEIRRYPATLVAQVNIQGSWSTARDVASRMLNGYIAGDNVRQEAFAMARPAGILPGPESEHIAGDTPVLTQEKDGSILVSYIMPAAYTVVTLPRPNNPEIRIVSLPPRTVAARTFTGWLDHTRAGRQEDLLRDLLATDRRGIVSAAMTAQYSPPWTPPFMQRNEILVPVTAGP